MFSVLNARNLNFLLKHPRRTLRAAIRYFKNNDVQWLTKTLEIDKSQVKCYLNDLYADTTFNQVVLKHQLQIEKTLSLQPGLMAKKEAMLCYVILRHIKPEVVVETGVANGLSSAYILLALHHNHAGHLWSIDLPHVNALTGEYQRMTPQDTEPGWLVPNELRSNWTLILGDARSKLPILVEDLKSLDVFIHDSLHTYEHMLWEYETAWPYLQQGGYLLTHDVFLTEAFRDFCASYELALRAVDNIGFVRKVT